MEQIITRIRQFLETRKLSVNQLAKEIGMEQTTVNRQLTGARAVSLTLVTAILSRFPDVSAEWLLRGRGGMVTTTTTDEILRRLTALEKAVSLQPQQ